MRQTPDDIINYFIDVCALEGSDQGRDPRDHVREVWRFVTLHEIGEAPGQVSHRATPSLGIVEGCCDRFNDLLGQN